jgi:riboflavin synthase
VDQKHYDALVDKVYAHAGGSVFTGLIEEVGTVTQVQGERITIAGYKILAGIVLGDSIAVDGVCLTVVQFGDTQFTAQVSTETLARSTLGECQPGSRVNLERSLQVGGKVGGHFVTGHVDGIGRVITQLSQGAFREITFWAPPTVATYLAPKGSITVNGVSLTVASCQNNQFTVAAIPYSLENTNLLPLTPGSPVNLEGDILAKYVERMLHKAATKDDEIDLDFMVAHGYG